MNKKLLTELCLAYGPSGYEDEITNYIINEIKDYVDDYYVDDMGNLITHKKGDGKKFMIAAHMDQIGMMITHISDEGFLYFTNIGGIRTYNCLSQRIRFKNGTVGVIEYEHLKDMKNLDEDNLFIDIGVKSKEEALKYVNIGDVCVYNNELFADDIKIISPALDNRTGCYVLIETIKQIKNPAYDLYFVFSVQEEVGLRGAKCAAYSVNPDYGLAYDICCTADVPGSEKLPCKVGNGAAIKIKDTSLLCHPKIINHLKKCANENKINSQLEILSRGGTDAGPIQLNGKGIPSGGISIPLRYIHGANELCSVSDLEDCIKLSVAVLESKII